MAKRRAPKTVSSLLLDIAVGLAADMLAERMPHTARMLGSMSDKPKTKRTKKATKELQVSRGVFYTPPTGRR